MVKETVLVEAGDLLTHVHRPHSGAISMMVRLSGGGRWRWRRSDVTASSAPRPLSTAGNRLTSAVVILPGTASVLDAADFRAAAHRSVTFRAMVARHEQALLATTRQSACNVSRSVEARLSRRLLRARDLCGGEALLLTQETLAQMIGVQRNAISIVAHALQQAGMIRCSRGYIDIANASGLKEMGCEWRCLRASSALAQDFALRPPRRWQAHASICATMRRATKRCRRMHPYANFSCQ